jgi:hypothetical protein
MAYLTSKLITNAYYLSGVVSRDFETPTGGQMSDGLDLLNDILADKTANSAMIPYSEAYTLNAVTGQSEYYIPNLISVDTFTFFIGTIRYQTRNQQRKDYFGSFRATAIESLPFNWHLERELDGARLFLYFVPNTEYPMEIWGQFRLASVTEFQDLSLTLDRFYINFLKYELAKRICQFFSYKMPQDVQDTLNDYYQWIASSTNTMDLRQQKLSTLTGGTAINYAIVNLSGGWVPV